MGICAFAFSSNHYHLLLRVEDTRQMSSFLCHFNSNLAREAGRLYGWREKFWGRRFQAIPISEEEAAQLERLRYVLAHGCKEGLVERLRDWPGVSAVSALLEEKPLKGVWFDRTQEYAARRRGEAFDRLRYASSYSLKLERLPCWTHLSAELYRERIGEMVDEIEAQAAAQRELGGQLAKGPTAIRAQDPHDRPEKLKRSAAPLFHAASRRMRRELYEAYAHFVAAFREAAERLLAGDRRAAFPAGSFPPALPWVGG
ncbi:MAG TPA: hypothetical protein VOA87_21075 [Thermoanaerobaculia bacterium]|nr:hypothetical protein [Thermoanaerobaculia bacterium]